MFRGGAERYFRDLAHLLAGNGWQVTVFQHGNTVFRRILSPGIEILAYPFKDLWELNMEFHRLMGDADLLIYGYIDITKPFFRPRQAITICHGIYWDRPTIEYDQENLLGWKERCLFKYTYAVRRYQIRKLAQAGMRFVSVDTNFINWARSALWDVKPDISYLPNYVDLANFAPRPIAMKPGKKVVVLFPRRLTRERGAGLMLAVMPPLLARFPFLHFVFCGDGAYHDRILAFAETTAAAGRVTVTSLDPDQMAPAYADADLVVIPSLDSEGTSLACLEAMACGKPVLVTAVGGLPNLVLQGYNGYIVPPSPHDLEQALVSLIGDPEKRAVMGANAREVAKSFSREIWEDRWLAQIEMCLDHHEKERIAAAAQVGWTAIRKNFFGRPTKGRLACLWRYFFARPCPAGKR